MAPPSQPPSSHSRWTDERAPVITTRSGPHQPAGVMVDHDGQVSLPLAMRDLVDPDPLQPVEQIDLRALLIGNALKDLAAAPVP